MVFTMDVQAVQLFPKTNASALYYSMKLKVHNLTFFDLADNQCSTYWWHECDGELDASVFTSIITKHLLNYCVSTACKRVIIFFRWLWLPKLE